MSIEWTRIVENTHYIMAELTYLKINDTKGKLNNLMQNKFHKVLN